MGLKNLDIYLNNCDKQRTWRRKGQELMEGSKTNKGVKKSRTGLGLANPETRRGWPTRESKWRARNWLNWRKCRFQTRHAPSRRSWSHIRGLLSWSLVMFSGWVVGLSEWISDFWYLNFALCFPSAPITFASVIFWLDYGLFGSFFYFIFLKKKIT